MCGSADVASSKMQMLSVDAINGCDGRGCADDVYG